MKKICALLLVLCLLPCVASATEVEAYNERLAAFEQRFRDAVAGTENETWSAAYEEPVTITTASSYGATMDVAVSKWGELYGETWNDNRFTKTTKMFSTSICSTTGGLLTAIMSKSCVWKWLPTICPT